MWLIKADTIQIHEFVDVDNAPPFAILSHTWADQECTFQHMKDPDVKSRAGYAKIQYCCDQALKDGLEWAWVDTCCIDKRSSAELSEAINSMFHWYRAAAKCYAYLSDVNTLPESDDFPDIDHSRWFARGWTLQELLAPAEVLFYSSNWTLLGSKLKLCDQLSRITNIDVDVLRTGTFDHISIATRLSWASHRKTTRIEDRAYCLMGIVGVNMPLLYGERERSFIRLQEEILKSSEDYSIFAWGSIARNSPWNSPLTSKTWHGLLVDETVSFTIESHKRLLEKWTLDVNPVVMRGVVAVTLPALEIAPYLFYVALPFYSTGFDDSYTCMLVTEWRQGKFARFSGLSVVPKSLCGFTTSEKWHSKRLDFASPTYPFKQSQLFSTLFSVPKLGEKSDLYPFILDSVFCFPKAQYSAENGEVTLVGNERGPRAVLFFKLTSAYKKEDLPIKLVMPYTNQWSASALKSPRPSFAVVLGIDEVTGYAPSLRLIHIVSETVSDDDFKSRLNRGGIPIHCWMTENQMASVLAGEKETSILWESNLKGYAGGWLGHLRQKHLPAFNIEMFVSADLRSEWKNIQERMVRLEISICVAKEAGLVRVGKRWSYWW